MDGKMTIDINEYEYFKSNLENYAVLLGRVEAFANFVNTQKHGIEREICGAILGFEVTENDMPD